MSDKYNGWTNYETWNVKLWMDNDPGSEEHVREMAVEAFRNAKQDDSFTRLENAAFTLADQLKDEHEEAKNDLLDSAKLSASVWADLLGAALSEVNWREIAESLLQDADVEEAVDGE